MPQQKYTAQYCPPSEIEVRIENVVNKVAADSYDAETAEGGWDSPERAQSLVEKYIQADTIVLDIGIGTGQAVRGYAEKGAVVIGLDRDQDMLTAAQSFIGESGFMRQADLNERLPVDDLVGKVDVAQAIGVLEFAEDLPSVIDQIEQTLAADGVFVFTVETAVSPFEDSTQQYADLTIHRHTPSEIRELLRGKGLSLLYEEAYGGYERGDTSTEKVPYHIFLAQKKTA